MSKKYLILGVNGMAGHMIAQYLIEQGQEIYGFARQKSPICPTRIGDAREKEIVKKLLSDSYDYVINAVGVLNQFVDANIADGIYLNSYFPHFVAEQLKEKETKLIHISTDCIFEGTKGRYTEWDKPDATSSYGRSKALGEVVDNKNLTIRTSIVGPEIKADGIGLLHWFLSQSGTVSGYAKVIWSGVTTLQLAKAIFEDAGKNQTGLYHLVNNEVISKYELLQLFNKYCRKHPIEIWQDEQVVSDKSLQNTDETLAFFVPSYEEMVKELGQWMDTHPIYKPYDGVSQSSI